MTTVRATAGIATGTGTIITIIAELGDRQS
jgi:hypothetical protein